MLQPQAYQTITFYEGRVRIPTSFYPGDWHPRAEIVVLNVDLPEDMLRVIVEMAADMGWGYNPLTRTFYRLD
jgi:hypothetical protein